MNFYIDLVPVYSYNTCMGYVSQYYAGFYRPDHDPPCAVERTPRSCEVAPAFARGVVVPAFARDVVVPVLAR